MKKTAVEWIEEQLSSKSMVTKSLFEQAKEMEKEQQGYSEEEVYDILVKHTVELFKSEPQTLDEFFKQFKNK